MPDITMCTNDECKLAKTCYRCLAIPNKFWQSYSKFNKDKDRCYLKYKTKVETIKK